MRHFILQFLFTGEERYQIARAISDRAESLHEFSQRKGWDAGNDIKESIKTVKGLFWVFNEDNKTLNL